MNVKLLLVALLSILLPSLASAHDYAQDALEIGHPWSRPTPPASPMGVGYMEITNTGDADITLTGAQTPRAEKVSIHQSIMHEGVMRMKPLDAGLLIPAGKTVELKPRSYHLMLEKLSEPLKEGERIPLTLDFDGADSIEVEIEVESLDAGSKEGAMGHSGHDMQ